MRKLHDLRVLVSSTPFFPRQLHRPSGSCSFPSRFFPVLCKGKVGLCKRCTAALSCSQLMHIDGRAGAIDICMRTQLYAVAAIFVLHHHIQIVVKMLFMSFFLALPIGKHIWPKTTFSVCVSRTFFRRLQLCYHEEKKRPKSSRDIEDVALSLTNSKLVGFGIVFRFYFALLRAMFVCCFIVHYLA